MQKEKSQEALFHTNIYKDPEPAKDSRACDWFFYMFYFDDSVKQKQAHISLGLLLLTFSGSQSISGHFAFFHQLCASRTPCYQTESASACSDPKE
jgi:hypothetical protein